MHSVGDTDVHVLVCSHDCDMANPRDRRGILLAPILPTPMDPEHENFPKLEASFAPDDETWSFINLFPLRLFGPQEQLFVADFSALTTAGPVAKAAAILCGKRISRLNAEATSALQRKLLVFIGRGD